MNKAEELEVLKTACSLEYMIAKLEEETAKLEREKPRKPLKPREPRGKSGNVALIPYPVIETPRIVRPPFWIRGVIIMGVCLAAIIITSIKRELMFLNVLSMLGFIFGFLCLMIDGLKSFWKKPKLIQKRIEEIRNSPEYQMQCCQIDEQNRMRQAELDRENQEKYRDECREYEIVLKDYEENQLAVWSAEIADLKDKILYTKNALQEVYNKKVIPLHTAICKRLHIWQCFSIHRIMI